MKVVNYEEKYSGALSLCKVRINMPNWVFISIVNVWKIENNSDRLFMRNIQVQREKSSIKVTKYEKPKVERTWLGPHISECTREKGASALLLTRLEKELRVCLPCWHDLQSKGDNDDKWGTNCFSLLRLGWPKREWRMYGEIVLTQATDELGTARW